MYICQLLLIVQIGVTITLRLMCSYRIVHNNTVVNDVGHLFSWWLRQMQTKTLNASFRLKYKFINSTIKHTRPHHNFSKQINICNSHKRM